MRVNRTTPKADYTAFRNSLLQDRRLSLGAHGLLTHCLSLQDGTQVDIKSLAAYFSDSQQRIAKYFREMVEVGYMIRRRVKDLLTSKIKTIVEIFDQVQLDDVSDLEVVFSQVSPSLDGVSLTPPSSYPSGKTGDKKPPRAPRRRRQEPLPFAELGGEESLAPEHAASAALLARVARIEPRLTLGVVQRASLLPLLAEWKARGASDRLVVERMTQGLPAKIFSPVALMKIRLAEDRMPVKPVKATPNAVVHIVCDVCHRPVSGPCGFCEGEDRSTPHSTNASKPDAAGDVAAKGAALARARLRNNGRRERVLVS